MRAFLVGSVLLVLGIAETTYAADNFCETDKRVASACRDIHGRLSVYANLRVYLWPIGTKRLLAIGFMSDAPDADFFLPDNAHALLNPGTDVFGDFHVCPFTPERAGIMQIVCVARASRLVARGHPSSPRS